MRSLTFTAPVRWATGLFFAALMGVGIASWAQDISPFEPLSTAQPDPAIQERIRAFEAGTARVADVPFSLRGPGDRPVYLFNAPCCDQFNRLYDADGRYICAPTGGFTGQGRGDCPAWVHSDVRWNEVRVPGAREKQPSPPRPTS